MPTTSEQAEQRARVDLSPEQVYALTEVLGRVTVRQLRGMGLSEGERAALDAAHESLVQLLEAHARAEPDPRQLVLHLHPAAPEQFATNARAFARAGRTADAMSALGRAFPTLAHAEPPGLTPWDPLRFAAWLGVGPAGTSKRGVPSAGCYHAGAFVLNVWTGELVPFDLFAAFAAWDDAHRKAFLEWARAPWYP